MSGHPEWPQAEVHLWRINLREVITDVSVLSPTELAKSLRFQQTRSLLRRLLGSTLSQPPESLQFEYGTAGKPALSPVPSHESLFFNLSHTNEVALIAVTASAEVGVDIEHIRPVAHAAKIARRFFSPSEVAGLAEELGGERFFQLWTRKEATLKAQGTGLFISAANSPPTSTVNVEAGEGYAAAVAVCGPMLPIRVWDWNNG